MTFSRKTAIIGDLEFDTRMHNRDDGGYISAWCQVIPSMNEIKQIRKPVIQDSVSLA